MNGAIKLSLGSNGCILSVHQDLEDLAITAANNEGSRVDGLDGADSHSAQIQAENEHLSFDMESTDVT